MRTIPFLLAALVVVPSALAIPRELRFDFDGPGWVVLQISSPAPSQGTLWAVAESDGGLAGSGILFFNEDFAHTQGFLAGPGAMGLRGAGTAVTARIGVAGEEVSFRSGNQSECCAVVGVTTELEGTWQLLAWHSGEAKWSAIFQAASSVIVHASRTGDSAFQFADSGSSPGLDATAGVADTVARVSPTVRTGVSNEFDVAHSFAGIAFAPLGASNTHVRRNGAELCGDSFWFEAVVARQGGCSSWDVGTTHAWNAGHYELLTSDIAARGVIMAGADVEMFPKR